MSYEADQELVDLILKGDQQAWEVFLRRFSGLLWRIVRADVGLPESHAQDAFQEVILKVLEDNCRVLRRWRRQASLAGYLTAVFRNAARDFVRTKCPDLKRQGPGEGEAGDTERRDLGQDPEGMALLEERRRAVEDCKSRLQGREQDLLHLRYMLELRYREIAARLSITVSNVGVALMRAEARLRRCLTERYPGLFGGWTVPAASTL
jgi:RNA polymerase sigma-70 factor (ECF subfamily)